MQLVIIAVCIFIGLSVVHRSMVEKKNDEKKNLFDYTIDEEKKNGATRTHDTNTHHHFCSVLSKLVLLICGQRDRI